METESAPYGRAAVLIPCYNEEPTVAKVGSDFRAALPGAAVYVYDNAGTGMVPRLPAALLATGLVFLSALALSTGFILDRATSAERRAFEMRVSSARAAYSSREGLSRRIVGPGAPGASCSRASAAAARRTSPSQLQGAATRGSSNSSRGR